MYLRSEAREQHILQPLAEHEAAAGVALLQAHGKGSMRALHILRVSPCMSMQCVMVLPGALA